VRFGAAAIVRLKSPFHTIYLSINLSTEKIKPIERRGRCQGCGTLSQGLFIL
jgi:hypothetical protein